MSIENPKKGRKILNAIAKIGGKIAEELAYAVGRKFIGNIVGKIRFGKKPPALIVILFISSAAFAYIDSIPYPISKNKQRLGWQTTGAGLVWRGLTSDTITNPINYTNKETKAYIVFDSTNGKMWGYRSNTGQKWQEIGAQGSGTVSSVAMTVPSFLSVSGSPITTSGTLAVTLSGTALPIANGGTGATTQQTAINALAGSATSGNYLRGNGTNVVMASISAGDVPTLNQNTTGSAATLTTSRTIQTNLASTSAASFNGSASITPGVTGTLPLSNGGTGGTTAGEAVDNLGPSTIGKLLWYKTTRGANAYLRFNSNGTISERLASGVILDAGGTTLGNNLLTITNPSAVTFPRFNSDNTVSSLSASDFRSAISAGTGSGTVTSVALSTGTSGTNVSVSGSPITSSGTITLNIPDASTSARGAVTSSTQTFGGDKTFNDALTVTGVTTLNGGALINAAASASSLDRIVGLINSTNALGKITIGTGLSLSGGTLSSTTSGTVTSVGLSIGTSGTNVNVSGSPITSSGTITLNIPDASTSATGLVTTGTQSFAGNKTFTDLVAFNKTHQMPIVTRTGNTTLTTSNSYVICNSSSTITITFPTAASSTGTVYFLKNHGTGSVVSDASNVVSLDGQTTSTAIMPSSNRGKFVTLICDGTNWQIMAGN